MRFLIISALIAISGTVYANCTQQTIVQPGGRITVCSMCCDANGNCTVVCTP